MRILLLLFFFIARYSWAAACEDLIANANLDRTYGNIYFNRWNLPEGTSAEAIMGEIVQRIAAEEHRPMLIFDTNPNAQMWSPFNIIRSEDDALFPGLTYQQLDEKQKDTLFVRFYTRAVLQLKQEEIPVLVFDHHFESKLLSDASSTPLVVDFLTWLNGLPDTPSREYLREVIESGVRLRDHSDPDILLANAAANWVMFPTLLKMHGEQIKRIAYYNDHGLLDPNLDVEDRLEVLLGYYLMMGFEKMVANEKGGFERALQMVDFGLERVFHVAHAGVIRSEDGLPELIEELKRFSIFDSTVQAMEQQKVERDLFQQQMKDIYDQKGALLRMGHTVIVRFPPTPDVPSGLEVMQYLKANPMANMNGAKYLAVVGRETHADGEYWHVKFRVLDGKSRLDPLIQAIRGNAKGGGGRSTAGGLYPAAGRRGDDLSELERDLEWALSHLR